MAADIRKMDLVDIELNTGNIHRSWLNHSIGLGDIKANAFGVRVFRNGEPVNVAEATCQGVMMMPNGSNILIEGSSLTSVSGNTAYVILPQSAYAAEGQFALAIRLIGSGITGTMRIVDGVINNTGTSVTVEPGTEVPTSAQIIAAYNDAVSVISNSVRYDITQSKTATEKQTARENIQAASRMIIAPEFAKATANDAGSLVTKDGLLYYLPNGHTANTEWADTTKTSVKIDDRLKSLSGDITTEAVNRAAGDASNLLQIAPVFAEATAYDAGQLVTNSGILYILPNGHTANTTWANTTKTAVKVASQLSELKSAIDSIDDVLHDTIYEIKQYKNESATSAGTSPFVCYFNQKTHIVKMKPIFATSGTFKWGIFTADGNIDTGATSKGTTTWESESVATGSEITLNRDFMPNEGIVIQANTGASLRGGLALASCEFPSAHFAQMNDALTYVQNYFSRGYGFPAVFSVYTEKDIPDDETFEKLEDVLPNLYDEIGYANESSGTVGVHTPFGATFAEAVYIHKIMPLFDSPGTFQIGIFKVSSGLSGTTTWDETVYNTGDIITLDREMQTDEGIVVKTFGNAYLRNGVPTADAKYAHTIFTAFNSDATSISSRYTSYRFPAMFILEEEKEISSMQENDRVVIVKPSTAPYHTADILYGMNKAISNGSRHLVLTGGTFNITDSIRVPNNFILEIENATIKLASGAKRNIIISQNVNDLSDGENIVIRGKNAVLDGNNTAQTGFNNDTYKRIGVLMFNVNGFDISGLTIKDTHGWGMSFESGCKNGRIHDIVIDQNGETINQDGINIRGGCHDIEIYNISGVSNDDFIACTAMLGNVMQVMNTGANGKDIYNISIHDIRGESGYCNIIDLICHDTCKTHDITIFNVIDESADGKTFESDGAYSHTLMVGNYDFINYAISGTPGTINDMYNIKASNIVSNSHFGIGIGWMCQKVDISNVTLGANVVNGVLIHDGMQLPFDVDGLIINKLYANGGSTFYPIYNRKGNLDNSVFKDFTVGECKYFLTDLGADMSYDNVAILNCNAFSGDKLYYLSENSDPFFDLFYIPSASAFTDLYPNTNKGQVQLGNNMPFRS